MLVLFWLGFVPLQFLLGDVWRVLNPWRGVADGVAWLWGALGRDWTPVARYPRRLGVWPAALLLFCFAAYELVYTEPANPRSLAVGIALYSYAMWFGMAAFGRREWDDHGNAFTVYFGLLARIAPFGEREGRLVARVPFTGLGGPAGQPGMLGLVTVMLGSVGYDGLSRTPFWADFRAGLQRPYILDAPGTADLVAMGLGLAGLLGCVLVVGLTYLAATKLAEGILWSPRPLAEQFVLSLVPIALVYAVAHYFTLFLIQGQYAIPLASDPFGYGWDLFGTLDYAPNIAPLSPNAVWYVQVGSLVAGHVAGLAIAHDRAVAVLSERDAVRSQYPMLALMVLYTCAGLWLLSRG